MSLLFPDAEIKQYGTQEECLEAVANGKVGATVIPSSKINLLNETEFCARKRHLKYWRTDRMLY